MEYIIDLKNAKTLWTLHEAIKEGLGLPDYYGMNMDALWDCITGYIDIPATIYIKSLNKLPKDLIEKGEIMKRILYEAQEWYDDIDVRLDIVELS